MGSYSFFCSEDITIMDKEGLRIFLKDIINHRIEAYYRKAGKQDAGTHWENGIVDLTYFVVDGLGLANDNDVDKAIDEGVISFSGFDNWKIISYWYEEMVMFFRDIAVFIDGNVNWEFECHDEGGYITFDKGFCTGHYGEMKWEEARIEQGVRLPEMSKHVFLSLGARKI